MKKSVYSLVLMDDVIKAVDREACRQGTSRSNLINQILAAHLACETPEMRMQTIFDSLAELIGNDLLIQKKRSASLMTMRTALDYKYRPTINYKVELDRSPGRYIGRLSVSIRTQSAGLVEMFDNFFLYWNAMETERLHMREKGETLAELLPVTYTRRLLNTGLDADQTAEALSRYIDCLDTCIKAYFSQPSLLRGYSPFIEEQYNKLIAQSII